MTVYRTGELAEALAAREHQLAKAEAEIARLTRERDEAKETAIRELTGSLKDHGHYAAARVIELHTAALRAALSPSPGEKE